MLVLEADDGSETDTRLAAFGLTWTDAGRSIIGRLRLCRRLGESRNDGPGRHYRSPCFYTRPVELMQYLRRFFSPKDLKLYSQLI